MRVAAEITGVEQVQRDRLLRRRHDARRPSCRTCAATGDDLVNAATLAVTMLDTESTARSTCSPAERSVQAAITKSRRKGVLDGRGAGAGLRLGAAERPDLELLGLELPARATTRRPSTCWPGTTTRPTCRPTLHAEFLHMWIDNALMKPGTIDGARHPGRPRPGQERPLRRRRADRPPRPVAARPTPRPAALGGDVAVRAVQQRAHPGPDQPARQPQGQLLAWPRAPRPIPDAWLQSATKHTRQLVGGLGRLDDRPLRRASKPRPRAVGDRRHPVLEIAPGRYVRE